MHTGPVGYGLRSVNYLPPVADDPNSTENDSWGLMKKHESKRGVLIPEGVDPKSEDYQPGGKYHVLREDLKKNRDPQYFIKVGDRARARPVKCDRARPVKYDRARALGNMTALN